MQKNIACPLCKSKSLNTTEKILTKDITALWLKQGVNTTNLFNQQNILEKKLCEICGLEFFDPIISGDNNFYSKLGEEEWYYLHEDKTEFEYSNKYIQEGQSLLDIGSGRGAFTKYINKNIFYTGLELSSKAVEYAHNEGINVIEKTIEDYASENIEAHDIVVTFQVLEHITNIDTFMEASIKVIKPNGLFIIAVPNNYAFIRNAQNNLLNLPPHHLLHWNERSLLFLAKKFDLEIIDIYKEKVTNVHKNWFYANIISKFIRDSIGIKTISINLSLVNKIINKISTLFSKIFRLSNIHHNYNGHTIAIVLRKK